MIIAKQKRKENIAEYILYMWQLEDVLRAYSFDIEKLVSQFSYPQHVLSDITQWYQELAHAMKNEGIETSGHLMQLKELVQDLSTLNIKLLQKKDEKEYYELFSDALPFISDIINKSDNAVKNEIDACFTGLYGYMLLKLQQKQISDETQAAMQTFSKLLARLSAKYHAYEKGELDID
ncbi:MAG TPA: DUF4924 family protein [Bacteroidales bacterium]|mgnify:FL=1|nr:MAG: hypothetical protein BWY22_01374 [Bacteroidetes bacterium ADurb.Bin217]HOS85398.1 DUF4924 family protein [Bacteroidales bacterium]HPH15898.1 DUF4924 family protein [Bacteroidales bacterium]